MVLPQKLFVLALNLLTSIACFAAEPDAAASQAAFRRQKIANFEQVAGPFIRSNIPLDPKVISTETLDGGIVRKKTEYHTDSANKTISAYLLLPADLKVGEKRPGVIVFHSTQAAGKDQPAGLADDADKHIALHLAKRGYVTIAPDYPSFGEYQHDFASDGYDSGVMKAICDNVQTLDLLCALPEVDAERIGAIGHSLGGHTAIFTALYDERIKAVVSNCGFTRFHRYYGGDLTGWTSDRYLPRIASEYGKDPDRMPFDFPDLISSLAPRAFLASSPLHDENFDVVGVKETISAARPAYERLGAADKLQANYPDCAHAFPPEVRKVAYEFLDEQLRHRPLHAGRDGSPLQDDPRTRSSD
ncbi:MAG: alpha/beta fold hydrolase [Planctomycetaceae bacterium]|nr:alpha/beta fold hydrolase [Planctomycetaceae bacterium]